MKVEDSNVANARKPAEMPTIMGNGEFIKSAMCPCCNLLMYIKDTECPHCGYLLTEIERKRQHHYSWKQRLKGYKLGGVFTIFLYCYLCFYSRNKRLTVSLSFNSGLITISLAH